MRKELQDQLMNFGSSINSEDHIGVKMCGNWFFAGPSANISLRYGIVKVVNIKK